MIKISRQFIVNVCGGIDFKAMQTLIAVINWIMFYFQYNVVMRF